ncbi:MAG: hypothetical protein EBR02_08745 [Alphaproteobacteria bacterium]|nr:hypothetical protein [Alphaproteobacteria bacterium]
MLETIKRTINHIKVEIDLYDPQMNKAGVRSIKVFAYFDANKTLIQKIGKEAFCRNAQKIVNALNTEIVRALNDTKLGTSYLVDLGSSDSAVQAGNQTRSEEENNTLLKAAIRPAIKKVEEKYPSTTTKPSAKETLWASIMTAVEEAGQLKNQHLIEGIDAAFAAFERQMARQRY